MLSTLLTSQFFHLYRKIILTIGSFLLFFSLSPNYALATGGLCISFTSAACSQDQLDSAAISAEVDDALSEDELVWAKELASLELPRRHLIC